MYMHCMVCIYTHPHTYSAYIMEFLSRSLSRWPGDSIGRMNSLRETAEITRKIRFHWENAAPRGSRATSSRPPRLRRYRLIKRSMLLEHVKFALAGERKARLIRHTRAREGRGRGNAMYTIESIASGGGRGMLTYLKSLSIPVLFFEIFSDNYYRVIASVIYSTNKV